MRNDFFWDEANKKLEGLRKKFNIPADEVYSYDWFVKKCKEIKIDLAYAINSVGSLGSGNHFIEFGISKNTGETWLTIHSGSRNFGKKVCDYWQSVARKISQLVRTNTLKERIEEIKRTTENRGDIGKKIYEARKEFEYVNGENTKDLKWLEGISAVTYLFDMMFTQAYAETNRNCMAKKIIELFNFEPIDSIETIHNYVDFKDFIIRKGAIRSYKGERMIIPFNMRDGILICEGKSNPDCAVSNRTGTSRCA